MMNQYRNPPRTGSCGCGRGRDTVPVSPRTTCGCASAARRTSDGGNVPQTRTACGCNLHQTRTTCGCNAPQTRTTCGCDAPQTRTTCGCNTPQTRTTCGCNAPQTRTTGGCDAPQNRTSCGCNTPAEGVSCPMNRENNQPRREGCGCRDGRGECNRLMEQIRAVDFALYETVLYLDAYPHSCDALETYHKLKAQSEALHKEYETACGPLTAFGNHSTTSWDWMGKPFPWEYGAD